ncbi:MAG: undecaprenyl-diphosphate phosphatase [Paracoccaceae bacterium]
MELLDIIALALIQGITEFLPISSSGHLALWPLLTGRPDQGVTMDVAVHLGTLVAVCLFFRKEVGQIFAGLGNLARGKILTPESYLVMLLAIATIPAVIFGLGLKLAGVMDQLRTVEVIGWATLLGGLLLGWTDRLPERRKKAEYWTMKDAALLGLAQAVALIPGTSRSGITMTMARYLGFTRVAAARVALLMAIPVILAAGTVETAGVIKDGNLVLGAELLLGAALSCVAALVALKVMLAMFASTWTMLPFVVYRLVLGVVLLWIAYA